LENNKSDHYANAIVSENATIKDAMEIIDNSRLRIALIVDLDGKLKGTLTDGDIRRYLIKDGTLDDVVAPVFNRSPITANCNLSDHNIKKIMDKHKLVAIPIISNDNFLVDLKTLNDLIAVKRRDNPVLIMAGGFGTRLGPLTENCPKPMLVVGDKPMLEHIIIHFRDQGFHNFYISTHFLPDHISSYFGDGSGYGVTIEYVHEKEPLGTGGALSLLPLEKINEPLILINGDILSNINFVSLLKHHESYNLDCTICVREVEHQIPYGVVRVQEEHVVNLVEKPVYRDLINMGIYVLSPSSIKSLPRNCHVDTPSLIEKRLEAGFSIGAFLSTHQWLDIGSHDDFIKAQTVIDRLGQ
jgi:dTDP-glucose pyrophosphorylase